MPNSVPIRRMRSSMSSRWTGSRPSVGSSSRTRSGSWAMAWASFTRCRCPVDMVPTGGSAPRPGRPARARRWPGRWPRGGEAVDLGHVAHEVVGPHVGREQVVLGGVADAGPDLGPGGRPGRGRGPASCPSSGWCRPSIRPSRVVLPAPLAPSSPVTPGADVEGGPVERVVDPHRLTTPLCPDHRVGRARTARRRSASQRSLGARGDDRRLPRGHDATAHRPSRST